MTPYCWKWCDKQKCFLTRAGLPANQPPHFRAEEGHSTNCNASRRAVQRDQAHPEYRLGIPTDYPARVKFFRERSGASRSDVRTPDDGPGSDDPDRPRARSIYRIREACEYYADNPAEHGRRLRIEFCSGSTYRQCFVRLGTGEHGNVGKAWIFYDQIWFTDFINLRAGTETFELPLLTTVRGEPRRLVVRTSKWLPRHREKFRQRLLVAIRGAKAALAEKRPERPWIFFHGSEAVFNQLEFEADLQPGVDVLMRDLPWTWNLRLRNGYRRGKRRQPFQDPAVPDLSQTDVIAAHAEQPGPAVPLVPDVSMPVSADKQAEPEVPAVDVDGGDRPNAPGGRLASVGGEQAALNDVQPSNSIGPQLVVIP